MFDQQKQQQNSRLGNILLNRGYVTQNQLDEALKIQQQNQLRLGEALLELGHINHKQLKRALRRQSWLRSITACIALVISPFSPAFAASQGNTGGSSTASSEITLTILPKTVNYGSDNIKFAVDANAQVSDGICTSNFSADIYRVTATGSGKQGTFALADNQQRTLNYRVAYRHQGEQFKNLDATRDSDNFSNNISNSIGTQVSSHCLDADANRLKVVLDKPKDGDRDSTYSGYLTLTIAAE